MATQKTPAESPPRPAKPPPIEPIDILRQGVAAWNAWRQADRRPRPDLIGADLRDRNLRGADLRGALLVQARLSEAKLDDADLTGADLRGASLREASLRGARLHKAVLRHTNLTGADITGAVFDGCEIFGAGLWMLQGEPASAKGMRIVRSSKNPPPEDTPTLEVDEFDAAQFLFVLLDNPRIGDAIGAINNRVVLILGRFGEGHLARLKAMQARLLATRSLVPIVFDFERPPGRSLTESVAGFAQLSLFVIADLTDPKSVPQELSHIVPFLPSVPVVPLVPKLADVYSMFEHFQRFPWVQAPVEYGTTERLLEIFDEQVLAVGRDAAARLRQDAERRWR